MNFGMSLEKYFFSLFFPQDVHRTRNHGAALLQLLEFLSLSLDISLVSLGMG